MKLLDPKLDVVFKLLFAHVNNRDILTALLTAVLRPATRIDSVEVLNPEVPKDLPGDKGAVLDIHLRLADGRHIDVEMQSELRPGMTQRFLYYWARLHASQLTIGEYYENLYPTVSVVILKESRLPLAEAHSTFRILEVETHRELTNDLEMHFIELSKVDLACGDDALAGWMLFLLARNDEELEEIAMSDPNIRRATEALRALSQDPEAQELARQREMAQINLKIMHQFAVAEGEAKGRAEGEAKGRAESLRLAIETAADLLALEVTQKRREEMNGLDVDGLTAILGTLRAERRWPGDR